MRMLAAAVFAVFVAAPAAAIDRIIELDVPGAMARIERQNPEHSRRIHGILAAAARMPCESEEFARIIRTAFDARDGRCALVLMTSLPAKRVLRFTLDHTHYRAVARMASDARVMPASGDAKPTPSASGVRPADATVTAGTGSAKAIPGR